MTAEGDGDRKVVDVVVQDKAFPPMRCDYGCGECCGVVPVSKNEYDRVIAYAEANGVKPVRQGTTCPWFQVGQCAVYEARPFPCRFYGHSHVQRCPRGYNVDLPRERQIDLLLMYRGETRAGGTVLLHDVCWDRAELEAEIRESLKVGGTKITINGKECNRPNDKAYAAARGFKLMGLGFGDTLFVDETSGELD